MRAKILFVVVLNFLCFKISSQEINVKETVYVHTNSTRLLSGETLYYSAQVLSQATGKSSPLSQILYVELIGKNDQVVFQHKIKLDAGCGHGQFFVSSLVSTGNYRLLAYTRWMKNFNEFFQTTVQVINPFEPYSPIPDEERNKLSVQFYPESGNLVAGVSNTVVYSITNGVGKAVEVVGRIVDPEGAKVADIKPDEKGLGRFSFTPSDAKPYQAIIEDLNGAFMFYKLPAAQSGDPAIEVRNVPGEFRIRILAPDVDKIQLKISDGQHLFINKTVQGNQTISLTKKELNPGVYRAIISRGNQVVASRYFVHEGQLKETLDPERITASTRNRITIPIQLEENATVSVSVRIKETTAAISTVDARMMGKFASEKDRSDWLQMDNGILVASSDFKQSEMSLDSAKFLPDLRGEWITGKIIGLEKNSTRPIFAICGEEYHFWSGKLTDSGEFSFLIEPNEGERLAFLRVMADAVLKYTVDSPFLSEYPEDKNYPIDLDSAAIESLVKRSVLNQIENAYFENKKDAAQLVDYWRPEVDQFDFFYKLDDYKRFPELYEYFIEYIPTVVARKNKKRSKINIIRSYPLPGELEPLILLDGLPVSAEEALNVNPYLIESIGVINNRIFIGDMEVDGLLALHTYKHQIEGFEPTENNFLKIDYQGVEPVMSYSFPRYDSAEMRKRLPDFRTQLFWDPELPIEAGESTEIDFYTSDVEGTFEVRIEGFTSLGNPISIRKTLLVEAVKP